jgi:hypothetical protein
VKPPDKRVFFRVSVAAVGLIALLGISFIVWRVKLAHDVNAKLQAIRAAGLPTNVNELNNYYPAVPDNENAALVMTQAFALMRNYPDDRSNEVANFKTPPHSQPLTTEQRQLLSGYVEMNAAALAKASEAVKLSKSRYPVDFKAGFETPLPHLDNISDLAHIFQYQSLLAIDSNKPMQTDTSITGILGVSRTLDEEPVEISQLVRFRLIGLAITTLERRLNANELTEGELTNFATAFIEREKNNSIKRALIGERAAVIPIFQMSFIRSWQLAVIDDTPSSETPAPEHQSSFLRMTGFLERDLHFYLDAMETCIASASLSPPQDLAMSVKAEKMGEDATHHFYRLSAMILPPVHSSVTREAEYFARIRISTTATAVERFRLTHGRLPENLNELTPQFLSAVPIDPFDGAPLRYHHLAKGYVVYSVGRDGHDNGGRERPFDAKSSDKTEYDITFTVER